MYLQERYDKPLVDSISDDEGYSPDKQLQEEDMKKNVTNWVYQLSDKQREVVCRRYGLCGYENSTLEQVAQEIRCNERTC